MIEWTDPRHCGKRRPRGMSRAARLFQPIRFCGGAVEKGSTCSGIEQACFAIGGSGVVVPAEIVVGVKTSAAGESVTGDELHPQPTHVQPCDFC